MAQGGKWDPTALPNRPGLYINFKEAAIAQVQGGARGTVAIPLHSFAGGTATAAKMYKVASEAQASALFGSANIGSIKLALQGGARDALVYTLPASPDSDDYIAMRTAFDAYDFNVFVGDGALSATEQDNTLVWVKTNRDDGKHFMAVFGCVNAADDDVPATGDARSIRLADDYAVNLVSGVYINGVAKSSADFAPWVAGLIAGTAINRSTTYAVTPAEDVTKRLTNAEIRAALAAGSFLLTNDGEKVKAEQGLTTSKKKIRAVRSRQAISTDITKTAADSYIGKLQNNANGQASLISAILAYLERLAANDVLSGPVVTLDPEYPSTGDSVYLNVSYVETDSMERLFFTINV